MTRRHFKRLADRWWTELADVTSAGVYQRDELDGLGPLARSYFDHALSAGVPAARMVELEMRGEIRIGRWMPFTARERLAPSRGFIWRAAVGQLGLIRGHDAWIGGEGGMDWRLAGLWPLVRAGDPDTLRSAVGRAACEAIWIPTALLPSAGAQWRKEAESDVSRVALTLGGETVELALALAPNGGLRSVACSRWCADEGREPGYRPFGGIVEEERAFAGFTIPSRLRVGWDFGTDGFAEGEFFRATVLRARFG